MSDNPGVWLGIKRCGCLVAVCADGGDHDKHTAESKREFLRDGLSVVYASWQDWREIHMARLLAECSHDAAGR